MYVTISPTYCTATEYKLEDCRRTTTRLNGWSCENRPLILSNGGTDINFFSAISDTVKS